MKELVELVNELLNQLVCNRLRCRHIYSSVQILKAALADMEDKCLECHSSVAAIERVIERINDYQVSHNETDNPQT